MVQIVIEGADSTGKTAIARHLADALGFEYIHCSAPADKDAAKAEYMSLQAKPSVVLDRFWIGEFVYAPMFRRYQPDYFRAIDSHTCQPTLYILLHSPAPIKSKGDIPHESKHAEISLAFINAFNQIKSGEKYIFNTSHFASLAQEKDVILQFVTDWINHEPPIKPFTNDYRYTLFDSDFRFINGNYTTHTSCKCGHYAHHKTTPYYLATGAITWGAGNLNATHVWIGEAPGNKGCGILGIPFYNDASGTLLRNAMFWNRILETEIYMTNICKCTPENNAINIPFAEQCAAEHMSFELSHLSIRHPAYIALGRTAERLINHGLYDAHARYIPHPAYALRIGRDYSFYADMKMMI